MAPKRGLASQAKGPVALLSAGATHVLAFTGTLSDPGCAALSQAFKRPARNSHFRRLFSQLGAKSGASGGSTNRTFVNAADGAMGGLEGRATTSFPSTCGFLTGNPSFPRTADNGFDCRTDTINGLWGFCPTTVIAATDCGLAGNCVDDYSCSTGCGLFGNTKITTFTCSASANPYCSTAVLTVGDTSSYQTYNYIACGGASKVDHLLATATSSTSTSSPTVAAAPSNQTPNPTSSQTSTTASSVTESSQAATSPTTTSSPAPPPSPSPSSNNTGPIVGGVIGGLALIILLVLGILFLRRGRSRAGGEKTEEGRGLFTSWKHNSGQQSGANKNDMRRYTYGHHKAELAADNDKRLPAHPVELPVEVYDR